MQLINGLTYFTIVQKTESTANFYIKQAKNHFIFDQQNIMYKDRYYTPHQLSYSAVTSYQTSSSNSYQNQRLPGKDLFEPSNGTYRISNKNQPNSDLAFLRNTVGPISSINTQSNYLKPNQTKKMDASLRQTMNVTSDIREKLRLSSPINSKRVSRAQTVNQSQLTSKSDKKQLKEDDRLQKIMSKYDKKNQTKQALKLLEQLKDLKRKQQQLKKQRKNDNGKQQESVTRNSNNQYDYNSPINFSKKNKVQYSSPSDKNQSVNSKNGETDKFFKVKENRLPSDIANEEIKISINNNLYKKEDNTTNIHTNKSASNLKTYYDTSKDTSSSYQSPPLNTYSFVKATKYDDGKDQSWKYNNKSCNNKYDDKEKDYFSNKYTASDIKYQNGYEESYKSYQSGVESSLYNSKNNNILSVTTKDNTTVSKSPNAKSNGSKDYVPSSFSYTTKSYSTNYDDLPKKSYSNNTYTSTNLKDVFANKRVTINDFVLGKSLGEGKFGTVYQAYDKKTKSLYALKKVPKQIIKSHWMVDQFILEVKIQNFLNHPNVLALHGCFDDKDHVYIMLQYMEQGTLFLHLKKNTTLCEKQAAIKLREIASAIMYLHQNGIAHRDLKPQNIVMSHGVCKLCDFGWATICDQRRKTYCGTFDYAAPQILEGTQYDMSVDLWCLGVLAYEILVGKAPFYHISRKQTMKKIMNCQNQKIVYPPTMSFVAKSFIENLLRKNPQQRIKSEDLLKHPFFLLADK